MRAEPLRWIDAGMKPCITSMFNRIARSKQRLLLGRQGTAPKCCRDSQSKGDALRAGFKRGMSAGYMISWRYLKE